MLGATEDVLVLDNLTEGSWRHTTGGSVSAVGVNVRFEDRGPNDRVRIIGNRLLFSTTPKEIDQEYGLLVESPSTIAYGGNTIDATVQDVQCNVGAICVDLD